MLVGVCMDAANISAVRESILASKDSMCASLEELEAVMFAMYWLIVLMLSSSSSALKAK